MSSDPAQAELEREVTGYPNVADLGPQRGREVPEGDTLLIPCILELPAGRLSMFTTLTTFGTVCDITLDELCIEPFYPSDDASERSLRLPT